MEDNYELSPKSRLFCIIFMFLWPGLHRLYVGKWKTAILYMVTYDLLGVGALIDLLKIIPGHWTDSEGQLILQWWPGWNKSH